MPVVAALQADAPAGFRPLRIEPGHGVDETDKVVFVEPASNRRWSAFLNPYTGEIVWKGADQALFTPWLLHLHMHLQIGNWGYLVTGLAAIALTLLSITGVYLNRDRLTALFKHPFRLRLGWRVALADLHKWVGMASLYFSFVLGATGLWFAILIVPGAFERAKKPPVTSAVYSLAQLAPIEPMVEAALAQFPGSELARIIFPARPDASVQIRVLHRDAPVWQKFSRVEFDPSSGAVRRVVDAARATTAEKWQAILGPLHFGYYGSHWVKWLYAIGGFMPALLAISGTAIYVLRSRKARRASGVR